MTRILVPLDGSPRSERVLATAERLAQDMGAEVYLLLVLDTETTAAARAPPSAARSTFATSRPA